MNRKFNISFGTHLITLNEIVIITSVDQRLFFFLFCSCSSPLLDDITLFISIYTTELYVILVESVEFNLY